MMNVSIRLLVAAYCLTLSTLSAQQLEINPNAPTPGAPAPNFAFSKVLQAPPDAKTDRNSLTGKVVILEFWATWCVPCIARLPILNALVSSTDPAKVQFISVTEEDLPLVESFLKKKAIPGWVAIDNAKQTFKNYGIEAMPATIVIDPAGLIASSRVPPEQITSDQLLALAAGQSVKFGGAVDPRMKAEIAAAENFTEKELHPDAAAPGVEPDFQISLASAAKAQPEDKMRSMFRGPGMYELFTASPRQLLESALDIPKSRITETAKLPDALYDLRVHAPHADPKQLAAAVELAISSGTKIRIEHQFPTTDAYQLQTTAQSAKLLKPNTSAMGFAVFKPETSTLKMLYATMDQLAGALEDALGTPVVNETAIAGGVMSTLKFPAHDFSAAKAELEKTLGLTLVPAKRPIERFLISPNPDRDQRKSAPNGG